MSVKRLRNLCVEICKTMNKLNPEFMTISLWSKRTKGL